MQESKTPWKETDQSNTLMAMLKLMSVLNPQSDRLPAAVIDVVVDVERRHVTDHFQSHLTRTTAHPDQ